MVYTIKSNDQLTKLNEHIKINVLKLTLKNSTSFKINILKK